MRRALGADMSLEAFARMLREKRALTLLLAGMPDGSTMAEALKLHRKLRQQGRTPCSFLDRELGIVR